MTLHELDVLNTWASSQVLLAQESQAQAGDDVQDASADALTADEPAGAQDGEVLGHRAGRHPQTEGQVGGRRGGA